MVVLFQPHKILFSVLFSSFRSVWCCSDLSINVTDANGFVGTFNPITTAETIDNFYHSMNVKTQEAGRSIILVHENAQTCDRSVAILHHFTKTEGREVNMDISGDFSAPTVQDSRTNARYVYDNSTETTTVTWITDETTAGFGHSLGPEYYDCITISPDFITGIDSLVFVWAEWNDGEYM
jgi:hypothetical protein